MAAHSPLPFDPFAIGVDEAGRGCLAGPVAVAACRLPEGFDARGIVDSKKLTLSAREAAEARIRAQAEFVVVLVGPQEIDERNILGATLQGMAWAVESLGGVQGPVLIDGSTRPPGMEAELWVKGDARRAEIAAASILAKTARDAWMQRAEAVYPGYGFSGHKGYPSPTHLEALARLGPCLIHRRSYAPVRALVQEDQLCLPLDG
jgi:ribonuclease HII